MDDLRKIDGAFVDAIIDELKKGGQLRDWRPSGADDQTSLEAHVRREVQRSIDRISMLRDYKPPFEIPAAADFRKAAKALRKVAFTDEQRESVRQLEAVRQTPPKRADALKYRCAEEVFDIMAFSAKAPTGYDNGPFLKIAALLYEAVTSTPHADVDMNRACDLVLRDRKQYNPNAFKR